MIGAVIRDGHRQPRASDRRGADLRAGFSGHCGVDLPEPTPFRNRLGGLERQGIIGLPGLSEPQVVRHFTRLSQKNYAIDTGLYPLGSCTMKHNPRLNEKLARLPGLADIHPLQPVSTVPGALELIDTLAHWLKTLTGLPAIALSPAAGAHGELCGMMSIRAALEARGDRRIRVLVPESGAWHQPGDGGDLRLHDRSDPADTTGRVDRAALKAKLGPDVAALMLTNPNTCGLFEDEIIEIADAVHRGRRVLLLRRRQFQRDRRAGAAGRSRHRLHAPQPAQDILDAAWRRRAGQRAGRAGAQRSRPYAPLPWIVHGSGRARTGRAREDRTGRAFARPAQGLSRPDGHVRARAHLHDEPRRRRAAAGRRGRGAQRQLPAGPARRRC